MEVIGGVDKTLEVINTDVIIGINYLLTWLHDKNLDKNLGYQAAVSMVKNANEAVQKKTEFVDDT